MSERLLYLLSTEHEPPCERDRIDCPDRRGPHAGPAAAALGAPRARGRVMTDDTFVERAEDELSWAGLVVAETLRVAELAVIALVALLVCPPLLILAVIVVVPAVAVAGVVALIVCLIALAGVRGPPRPPAPRRHAHLTTR